MNTKISHFCAAIALAGGALGTTMNANAGCPGYSPKPAAFDGSGDAGLVATGGDFASIVGMWRVRFMVDGNVIDDALASWHADGTEIMNSSRPPSTQSFCMGVWKQVGRGTYRLRHLALSWVVDETTPPGGAPLGPAEIHETVVLDRTGNHFTGNFTIDQYETDQPGPGESGTPIVHVTGSLIGDRVSVN
jgi:hypothetical protein